MVKKRTARNTGLWVATGGVVFIGALVIVSAWGETSKGETLIENPGTLLGIAITALGGILVAILPAALRLERNSEEVKEQVQNAHKNPDGTPLNLRDDLDDKHTELLEQIMSVKSSVGLALTLTQANASDVRGMRRDMGRIQDRMETMSTDLRKNTDETTRVGKIATGLVRTVGTLEGEVQDVRATIVKYHPDEESHEHPQQ